MADAPFYLQLMIGPGVPVPVGTDIMDALVSVQVTSNTEGASAFQLTFSIPARSPLQTLFLFASSAPIPLIRVVILVIVSGMPEVLMDGVVTHQQVQPGEGGGGASTLVITGEDLSKVMSYLPLDGIPYPAMPPNVRVMAMLAKYLVLGVVPVVIPSVIIDIQVPTDSYDRQQGTDLEYVKFLADQVGYEFYVDPGPLPLQSVAYWGPRVTIGIPQPALNTNMDAETNVEQMSFAFDAESATLPVLMIYPKETKIPIPIPIPNVNPLAPPLGLIPPIPKNIEFESQATNQSPATALLIALAKASKTQNAVTAQGTLDVARYGRVLKARKLVGVRGAGMAFDGLYYVKSVTHNIKRGEYKQSFSLERNALVSITPRVPV